MDIKELSIGDWVRYDFLEIGKRNIQVDSIDEEGNRIGAGGIGASVWSNVSEFEPIPITPEILEKNGVTLAEDYGENGCLFTCPSFSVSKYGNSYTFEVPQARVRVEFVHQLQHAMRLAGIEKENGFRVI